MNATLTDFEYFPGTNTDWSLSIDHLNAIPLTVLIEHWPANPDAPRQWSESTPLSRELSRHVVNHLRPGASYELKANGHRTQSLHADAAGQLQFTYLGKSAGNQDLELVPASQ